MIPVPLLNSSVFLFPVNIYSCDSVCGTGNRASSCDLYRICRVDRSFGLSSLESVLSLPAISSCLNVLSVHTELISSVSESPSLVDFPSIFCPVVPGGVSRFTGCEVCWLNMVDFSAEA